MGASKAACRHDGVDDEVMVSYAVLGAGSDAREHATVLWCRRCGALGDRRYTNLVPGNVTRWTRPTGKTEGAPRRKRPLPVPISGRGNPKRATKAKARLASK